jgi:hypothetical protein
LFDETDQSPESILDAHQVDESVSHFEKARRVAELIFCAIDIELLAPNEQHA